MIEKEWKFPLRNPEKKFQGLATHRQYITELYSQLASQGFVKEKILTCYLEGDKNKKRYLRIRKADRLGIVRYSVTSKTYDSRSMEHREEVERKLSKDQFDVLMEGSTGVVDHKIRFLVDRGWVVDFWSASYYAVPESTDLELAPGIEFYGVAEYEGPTYPVYIPKVILPYVWCSHPSGYKVVVDE